MSLSLGCWYPTPRIKEWENVSAGEGKAGGHCLYVMLWHSWPDYQMAMDVRRRELKIGLIRHISAASSHIQGQIILICKHH